MEKIEHAVGAAHGHLLKAKIAYLEGDFQKAAQHSIMAGDIASYTVFNKVGGVERIIAAAEHKVSELETLIKARKKEA